MKLNENIFRTNDCNTFINIILSIFLAFLSGASNAMLLLFNVTADFRKRDFEAFKEQDSDGCKVPGTFDGMLKVRRHDYGVFYLDLLKWTYFY